MTELPRGGFDVVRRGYDVDQVDDFLMTQAEAWRAVVAEAEDRTIRLQREVERLRLLEAEVERLRVFEDEVLDARRQREALTMTLHSATQAKDRMLDEVEEEIGIMRRKAADEIATRWSAAEGEARDRLLAMEAAHQHRDRELEAAHLERATHLQELEANLMTRVVDLDDSRRAIVSELEAIAGGGLTGLHEFTAEVDRIRLQHRQAEELPTATDDDAAAPAGLGTGPVVDDEPQVDGDEARRPRLVGQAEASPSTDTRRIHGDDAAPDDDLRRVHDEFTGTEFVDAEALGADEFTGTEFVDAEALGAEFVDAEALGAEFVEAGALGADLVEADLVEFEIVDAEIVDELDDDGEDDEPSSLDDVVEATVVDADDPNDEPDDDVDGPAGVVIDLDGDPSVGLPLDIDDVRRVGAETDRVVSPAPVTQPMAPVVQPPIDRSGGMWFAPAEDGEPVESAEQQAPAAPPPSPSPSPSSAPSSTPAPAAAGEWLRPGAADVRSGTPPMPDTTGEVDVEPTPDPTRPMVRNGHRPGLSIRP